MPFGFNCGRRIATSPARNTAPAPLIVSTHGWGGSGSQDEKSSGLASVPGVAIAAFPDGLDDVEHFTADALSRMPYLWAVCQESLRMYPPVPITNRVAATDDVWNVNGTDVKIPKVRLLVLACKRPAFSPSHNRELRGRRCSCFRTCSTTSLTCGKTRRCSSTCSVLRWLLASLVVMSGGVAGPSGGMWTKPCRHGHARSRLRSCRSCSVIAPASASGLL